MKRLLITCVLFLSCLTAKADMLIIAPTGPNYYPYNLAQISTGHAFGSSFLTGLNISSFAVNGMQMKRNSTSLALPIIGIGAGLGQVAIGALYYRQPYYSPYYGDLHSVNNALSIGDISLGTLSAAFNTYALIRAIQGKKKRSDLSWNVYGFRHQASQQFALGFSLKKYI